MADETPPTAPSDAPPPLTMVKPESVPIAEKETSPLPVEAETEKQIPLQPPLPATAESVSFSVSEKETPLPPPPPPLVSVTDKETPLAAAESESDPQVKATVTQVEVIESEKPKPVESKKLPESLVSFKEESNIVTDLSEFERKAFDEFKQLVQEALNNHLLTYPPPQTQEKPAVPTQPISDTSPPAQQTETHITESANSEITSSPEEVLIWGMPLLKDDRSDLILLKFLRARDFKVKDALTMLKNTLKWRKEFEMDALVIEDLGDDLEKVVFMHGYDKEGHSVCYNVYGEFLNKELYKKTFSDEEKRKKFLRWRIQFLERSIRKLDFSPGGISTIFQVSDLKNSPGPGKRELRIATRQALQLLQDNYPEFVAKQVFINVPWWYLAFYTMMSPFLTQRTKSKFVFAGPSKTAETLFKYIPPEQVPIQYGGLSVDFCDCNPEFTMDDPATEITVKPATKQTVEILVHEKCIIVWELRVVGWEVSYSAEYVPNAEGAYIVIIHKARRMVPTDEPVVSNSFRVSELGKLLINIDNPTSKKKKLLYRFKVKPFCD